MKLIDAERLADELAVLLERNERLIDPWLAEAIEDIIDGLPSERRSGGGEMRLINADTLKEQIPETSVDIFENCRNCSLLDKDQILEIIDEAPTSEAEPVVRCKDCKFYLNSNETCGLIDTRLRFYETDKVWTEDSFCSWGERREDERK